jgi:short-subunit dehydrogenase
MDWIITGASRGIGRALAVALAARATARDRFFVLARDRAALDALAASLVGVTVVPYAVDLGRRDATLAAGHWLAEHVRPGATIVHNAGVWPTRRTLVEGWEAAFVVNGLAPLRLQALLVGGARRPDPVGERRPPREGALRPGEDPDRS